MIKLPLKVKVCRHAFIAENDALMIRNPDICLISGSCKFDGKPCDIRSAILNWEKAEKPGKEDIMQQIAQYCAKCRNTFSGSPMLVAKGRTLQCRLKTCNRKKVKNLIKQLEE